MVLLFIAFGVNATNYYLKPDGSDDSTGTTQSAAWATLTYADFQLFAGDTLFVMGGTYNTAQKWVGGNGGNTLHPVVIKAYGDSVANFPVPGTIETKNNYFLFWGSTDIGHIIIDGESYIDPSSTTRYFKFTGACHRVYMIEPTIGSHRNGMVLRGCEIDGTASAASSEGAYPVHIAYADSFEIDNCYIHHAWRPTGSIPPGDGTDNYQVSGECLFVRSCEFGKITDNVFEFGNHGVVNIQTVRTDGAHPSRYITISGITFNNGWGGGLYLTFNSEYCLVENNVFANCGVTTDYPKPCLQLGGSNNTIRKNVFYNPTNQAISVEAAIDVSPWYSVCDENYIYNNTLFMSKKYAIQILVKNDNCATCSAERNVIANNIFYKTQETLYGYKILLRPNLYHSNYDHNWVEPDESGYFPETTEWGYNRFWNNLYTYDQRGLAPDTMVLYASDSEIGGYNYPYSINALENDGSGSWANSIGGDPLFASESPDVYGDNWWYLQSGSPCIDAGDNVNDTLGPYLENLYPGYGWDTLSYNGSEIDIGAYETAVASGDTCCNRSPTGHDFGAVDTGSTSNHDFIVSNCGTDPLYLSIELADSTEYNIQSGGGLDTVLADSSHTITVQFAPITGGSLLDTLTFGMAACIDVPLSGMGTVSAVCSLGIASITFDTLTSYTYSDTSFYIYNTAGAGGEALTGTVALATGTKFSLQAGSGALSVDAEDSLLVTVRFTPTASRAVFDTVTTGTNCDDIPLEATLYIESTAWYQQFMKMIMNHMRR